MASTTLHYCHNDCIFQNEISLIHCQCLTHWFDDMDKIIKNQDCSEKYFLLVNVT